MGVKRQKRTTSDWALKRASNTFFRFTFLDLGFQRLSCWETKERKKYLVALLEGQAISPIILADAKMCRDNSVTEKDRKYYQKVLDDKFKYISVDGNNRSTTIELYRSDKFSINGTFENDRGEAVKIKNLKYSELNPIQKELIDDIDVSICIIENATHEGLRRTFRSINDGQPLNSQEKRNAIFGKVSDLIRSFELGRKKIGEFLFGSKKYIRRDFASFMAHCLRYEDTYINKSIGCTNLDKMYEDDDLDKIIMDKFEENMNILLDVVESSEEYKPKKTSSSWYFSLYTYIHELRKMDIRIEPVFYKEFGKRFWEEEQERRLGESVMSMAGYQQVCRYYSVKMSKLDGANGLEIRRDEILEDYKKTQQELFNNGILVQCVTQKENMSDNKSQKTNITDKMNEENAAGSTKAKKAFV